MEPIRPQRGSEAGFTLIEALIAIVMLMVGLAAVANLFVLGVGWNHIGKEGSAAVTEASDKIEQLKVQPYGSVALAPGGDLESDVTGYHEYRGTDSDPHLTGTGRILTRWQIIGIDPQTLFIRVRSQSTGPLGNATRAEFTTFRTCTAVPLGCPAP